MTPRTATSTAPALGFAEAARVTGVSESTLRRKRPELLAAGATRTDKGAWRIPIPVLIELGLMPNTTPATETAPDSPPVTASAPPTTAPTQTPLEPLVEALREKLAAAEQRAAVAEAVAAERERIIEAQAQTLRMIEAPKTAQEEAPAAPAQEPAREELSTVGAPADDAPKRRWWRR